MIDKKSIEERVSVIENDIKKVQEQIIYHSKLNLILKG